jgi:cytochrome P450
MLALGTAVLLENRELWNRLIEDPDSAGPIVDELLRLLSVVQVAFPRFVKDCVVVGGKEIRSGSVVLVSLPAANRDPRAGFGESVDFDRATTSHLAFGYGFHRCVGAELARMELKMAFTALARRFPDMELAVAPEDLDYRMLSIVYGVESVPVRLGSQRR